MKVDVKPIVLAAGALLLFCGLGTFTSERFYDVSSSNYFMQFQKGQQTVQSLTSKDAFIRGETAVAHGEAVAPTHETQLMPVQGAKAGGEKQHLQERQDVLSSKLKHLASTTKREKLRLAALREAASHEQSKVAREQHQLREKESNLAREEKVVARTVARDQASLQKQLQPAQHAVFTMTDKFSREQERANADADNARDLHAAIQYEHKQEQLDGNTATAKGQLSLQDASMMARLRALSVAEKRNAAELAKTIGSDSAHLASLVAQVRHDSEIAYEQQQEATRLKKKGQQKLAHTLEHIAFEKTEQVNKQLATVRELNSTLAALREAEASNETANVKDERDALEMQFLSKINAQEALMWNRDDELLHQKVANSTTTAAVLVKQAVLESAIAHAQKRLIDVKVGQWMLKRVQLKQKLAPHRSKASPLSAERAAVKKMQARNAKDTKLASQMASLADGVAKRLATARMNDAEATLTAPHHEARTQLAHATGHGTAVVQRPTGGSEVVLRRPQQDLMAHAVHQAVRSSTATGQAAATSASAGTIPQGGQEASRAVHAWHGVEGPVDYSHGW